MSDWYVTIVSPDGVIVSHDALTKVVEASGRSTVEVVLSHLPRKHVRFMRATPSSPWQCIYSNITPFKVGNHYTSDALSGLSDSVSGDADRVETNTAMFERKSGSKYWTCMDTTDDSQVAGAEYHLIIGSSTEDILAGNQLAGLIKAGTICIGSHPFVESIIGDYKEETKTLRSELEELKSQLAQDPDNDTTQVSIAKATAELTRAEAIVAGSNVVMTAAATTDQ
jgi:hypothetical protein